MYDKVDCGLWFADCELWIWDLGFGFGVCGLWKPRVLLLLSTALDQFQLEEIAFIGKLTIPIRSKKKLKREKKLVWFEFYIFSFFDKNGEMYQVVFALHTQLPWVRLSAFRKFLWWNFKHYFLGWRLDREWQESQKIFFLIRQGSSFTNF